MPDPVVEFASRRLALIRELDDRPSGLEWCERHTRLTDSLVSMIVPADAPVAVIATGGYGRRELAPFSDVDLTVVPVGDASPRLDDIVRDLFRNLHDAFVQFGLPLGYAFRLVADAPGLDAATRTGLLDMRFVAGDPAPVRPLAEALRETFSAGDFALAKIEERVRARARTNDTPLAAEPHLKEGAGGLRDFHAANWLRTTLGERTVPPTPAYDQILLARNLLHRVSERYQDVLSRSRLAGIAKLLHRSTDEVASEFAQARLNLDREYRAAIQRLSEARFELGDNVYAIKGEIRVAPGADAGKAALAIGIGVRLGLSVSDFPSQIASAEAGPEALSAIADGERTIRAIDEAGVLDLLIPELASLRTRMPQDPVHAYTVFEHTIRAVREIDRLEADTPLGRIKDQLPDRGRLVLATLLHDIGKVAGDEGHADLGAEMSRQIVERWRLADSVAADVVWLVRNHLEMARFVRMRDLDRSDTIDEFAQIAGTPERLALLTLLTFADVKAVGPNVWTPAMDTFLRQLYDRTLARLQVDVPLESDLEGYRRRLVRRLNDGPGSPEQMEAFVASLPAHYLAGTPPELIRLHQEYAARAAEGRPTVEAFVRPDLSGTELTVVCADQPGLLSKLLGVLYAHDLSILTIRASTTSSQPPIALDTFVAAYGGQPVPEATLRSVSKSLKSVVSQEKTVDEILRTFGKDPERQQSLFRWNYVPGFPGVLEVRAPKGRGMPYRMARKLAELGWNIVSARVGQWAGTAAAAFYLVGPTGVELRSEEVEAALTSS